MLVAEVCANLAVQQVHAIVMLRQSQQFNYGVLGELSTVRVQDERVVIV
jgi:hypothetical protein